jgi:hypothetical protein
VDELVSPDPKSLSGNRERRDHHEVEYGDPRSGVVQPTPTSAQATTNVVLATTPSPIVTSVHWSTTQIKTGSGKKARTKSETALEIPFSAPVAGAGDLGAYELSAVTTKKVKKKTVTTLKPIRLSSVVPASSPMTTSIKLVPAGKVNLVQTDEIENIAADIVDAQGSELDGNDDGNDDGNPGGNFGGRFSRNGVTLARSEPIANNARLSPSAVDAVLRSLN